MRSGLQSHNLLTVQGSMSYNGGKFLKEDGGEKIVST